MKYELTYGRPAIFAAVALWLKHRRGATVAEVCEEFQLHRRRAQRHLAALSMSVFSEDSDWGRLDLYDREGRALPRRERFVNGYAGEDRVDSVVLR